MSNVEYFPEIDFEEVYHSWGWNLVVDYFQNVKFKSLNFFDCQFLMRNFLMNHFHFKRIDVLILGSHKHACHSNDMQVADLSDLRLELEVSVHQTDSQEECLVVTFEIGKNFYFPVNHTRSQSRSNFMSNHTIFCEILKLKDLRIVNYRIIVVSHDINVLSLDVSGTISHMV